MQIFKKYFFIFLYSVCLQLTISFLIRQYLGIEASSFIGFIAYFFLQVFLSKTKNDIDPFRICLVIISAILILQLPLRITSFESTSITFIDFIFNLLGAPFALLLYRLNNQKIRKYSIAMLFLLVAVSSIYINELWRNKINYGTYTGHISPKKIIDLTGIDEDGKRVASSSFKNKTVLIDFWNTSCSVCFKKFPILQEANNSFKNDSNFVILAANHPLNGDSKNQAFEMIKKRNYTFKTFILDNDKVASKVGVNSFPTTIIINKEGNMIFFGAIEAAIKKLEEIKRDN